MSMITAEQAVQRKRRRPAPWAPGEPITGTLGAVETADIIEFTAPNLRERYLLGLLTRDAKIWRERKAVAEQFIGHDNDPHVPPHTPRKPSGETEQQAERVAAGNARAAAITAGEKTYIRPKPCKRCGGNVFLVRNYACIECSRRSVTASQRRLREELKAKKKSK
jgi:hypothetical protein